MPRCCAVTHTLVSNSDGRERRCSTTGHSLIASGRVPKTNRILIGDTENQFTEKQSIYYRRPESRWVPWTIAQCIVDRYVQAERRVFRGWWIVLVAVAGQCFSLGTMVVYTFGVFAKPLAAEFGSTRGAVSLSLSLLNIMVTVASPGAGRLVDRFGARRVIVTSIAALAACLFALSSAKPPIWNLYILYAMCGLLGAGGTPVTYSRVVANWFDRRRGIAL